MRKIGFIGAGNMATAIVHGIVKAGLYAPAQIYITDVAQEKLAPFIAQGMHGVPDAARIAEECDWIVLAVKPQNFPAVLPALAPVGRTGALVISIAAGISIAAIKQSLGEQTKVVRVMPNTPLLLGCGATALSCLPPVSAQELAEVEQMFASMGKTAVLSEADMNKIISVNGSSPAYFYLFAKLIIDGAVAQGIDAQTAQTLVLQTMLGSAQMLCKGDKTPEELIRAVSSPGGTTLAALSSFEKDHLDEVVLRAMQACTKRAEELAGQE